MKTRSFGADAHSGAPGATSDTALYLVLLLVGLAIVVPTLVQHLVWGVQPTLGALLCAFAGRALLVALVLRRRARATAHQEKSMKP